MKTEPKINWDEWEAVRLASKKAGPPKRPGPEWITAQEFADNRGIYKRSARRWLSGHPDLYERKKVGSSVTSTIFYRLRKDTK